MSICESIRADLDAYRDQLLDQNRMGEIFSHLETCIPCSKELKRADSMEQTFRASAATWAPPKDLWARIKSSVDSIESGADKFRLKHRRQLSWVAAAVLVLAIVITGINFDRQRDPVSIDSVVLALVNEFHTFVISRRGLDYVDSQPLAIKNWFGDKVDFRMPLPVNAPDLQLAGGRLCNMLDQRVASYMYQSDGAWVSLYIMKYEPGQSAQIVGREVVVRGYGYIEWQGEGLRYSLVGDVSVDRLRRIANSMVSTQLYTDFITTPQDDNLQNRRYIHRITLLSFDSGADSGQSSGLNFLTGAIDGIQT